MQKVADTPASTRQAAYSTRPSLRAARFASGWHLGPLREINVEKKASMPDQVDELRFMAEFIRVLP
jgi:hypothetical protein